LSCMLLTLYHEYNYFSTHLDHFDKKISDTYCIQILYRSWCMLFPVQCTSTYLV
jgi:hypothetical protein